MMMLTIEALMTMMMASKFPEPLNYLLWVMFVYNVIGVLLNYKAYSVC